MTMTMSRALMLAMTGPRDIMCENEWGVWWHSELSRGLQQHLPTMV